MLRGQPGGTAGAGQAKPAAEHSEPASSLPAALAEPQRVCAFLPLGPVGCLCPLPISLPCVSCWSDLIPLSWWFGVGSAGCLCALLAAGSATVPLQEGLAQILFLFLYLCLLIITIFILQSLTLERAFTYIISFLLLKTPMKSAKQTSTFSQMSKQVYIDWLAQSQND